MLLGRNGFRVSGVDLYSFKTLQYIYPSLLKLTIEQRKQCPQDQLLYKPATPAYRTIRAFKTVPPSSTFSASKGKTSRMIGDREKIGSMGSIASTAWGNEHGMITPQTSTAQSSLEGGQRLPAQYALEEIVDTSNLQMTASQGRLATKSQQTRS